ncbi:MAG TPA: glutamyl-tRNA reductase [Candidatus Acidoferrales bacterium]|nr:glutamyl-tRNA reductase [Candidatus Acidoferrales bacterium]
MEPTLVVIGISYRTAALAVRERFWIGESRRFDALTHLVRSEGIDEVIVVSNCNRTEFYVWTQNAGEAANSVLRFLTRAYDLKLSEWSSFYRLLDDVAMEHVVRVASGQDAAVFGEPEVTSSIAHAWNQAQKAETTGRFLNAVMKKAITVAARVKQYCPPASTVTTVANSTLHAATEASANVRKPKALVVGAGAMAEATARALYEARFGEIVIVNRTYDHAARLAMKIGVRAAHFEELWQHVIDSDVLVCATSGRLLITRAELDAVLRVREDKQLLIVDQGVPRNVDPAVRALQSVIVYDVDDLCEVAEQHSERSPSIEVADRVVREEVAGFRRKLLSENVMPTLSALRARLEEICDEEMEKLTDEFGPFTEDQMATLRALSAHITQRISATLGRRLKELPDKEQADPLATALETLFQLETRQTGTALKK